jgi:hypothetical protein
MHRYGAFRVGHLDLALDEPLADPAAVVITAGVADGRCQGFGVGHRHKLLGQAT